MKDTNRNQSVKRFKVDTYIDLNNLDNVTYGVTVIYGRKQKERARFKHSFVDIENAISMCKELEPAIGVMFPEFADNPIVVEVSKKYVEFARNKKVENEPASSNSN